MYALPDKRKEMQATRYLNARINAQVGKEDYALMAMIAPGLRSSAYNGGMLSDKEYGVRHFHDQLRAALPVFKLDQAPSIGTVAECNRRMGG